MSAEMIMRGVAALHAGLPLIFPTDTVYGLGLAVGFASGPDMLYDLKERDHGKPVAWLVASPEALHVYGKTVSDMTDTLVRTFWPGSLTVVVKASEEVPHEYCAHDSTIALRMPDNELALALISGVGVPLATTSANISGQKPPKRFEDLDAGLVKRVGLALRDDVSKSGMASTVIDCTKEHPVIIREGSITSVDIRALG